MKKRVGDLDYLTRQQVKIIIWSHVDIVIGNVDITSEKSTQLFEKTTLVYYVDFVSYQIDK